MRLEKILLDGFKSFADKTEFTFDSPVSCAEGFGLLPTVLRSCTDIAASSISKAQP